MSGVALFISFAFISAPLSIKNLIISNEYLNLIDAIRAVTPELFFALILAPLSIKSLIISIKVFSLILNFVILIYLQYLG